MNSTRKFSHRIFLTLACLFICGCQPLVDFVTAEKPPKSTTVVTLPTDDNWADLLHFTEWLYQQPPHMLTPLYQQALTNELHSGKALDKLNLALLLVVPGTDFQNSRKALQLVDEGLAMATHKQAAIRDMLRLNKVNLQALQQLQLVVNEQQQQLEQLKSIEKNLVERRELLE